ncbi:tripartite tricarboxylate transporter substrate-binding protein [Hydrogenophaga sp. 2FB]|uniref:tripartite tricarboxylate transporter substrate-binding protein n=1 Tax=Hydrogenophaga sp. 2FB TaxID=2502187 RepID=UPI00207BCEAD|nr:tripartite tricarboxylate transporter substrate-binding protein [Hydrogenophaga sp. 2FB]
MTTKNWKRQSLVAGLAVLGSMVLAGTAMAQTSGAPVRILVGFPPGGNVDSVARNLAAGMQPLLNRSVVVENRPGAGGQIAMQTLALAPNDGRTLMLSNEHAVSIIPMTVKNPGYVVAKDLVPVATVTTLPIALAVHPSIKANNLQELVAWARQQKGAFNVGVPAPASQPDFTVGRIGKTFGLSANSVPYRGGAPLVADLLGGQILVGLTGVSEFIPHHKSGAMRIIAISGQQRLAQFPEIPTFTEGGLPGLEERTFMGLFAPAGTSADVLAQYREVVRAVTNAAPFRQALIGLGLESTYGDDKDLASRVKHTTDTWGPIIKESGFVAQ